MNINFIANYIERMSKDDVWNIAYKQGINLDDGEVDNIYGYIKNNYKKYLDGNIDYDEILDVIKKMIRPYNYKKVLELYDKYKGKEDKI